MAASNVSYEDVVIYKDNPKVYLIDVRNPDEQEKTGKIPGSINIPLPDLEKVLLNTSAQDFNSKYGRNLPEKGTELIFFCTKGGRGGKATDAALNLGFTNSRLYKGGWQEWCSKQQ